MNTDLTVEIMGAVADLVRDWARLQAQIKRLEAINGELQREILQLKAAADVRSDEKK